MSVSIEERDDATIVAFQCNLTMDEVVELQSPLRETVSRARSAIVASLAAVEYVDSSGTGLLVSLLQWTRESGRRLILAEMCPGVEKVFRLSNLDKVFDIVPSVSDALQALHPQEVFLFDDREDIVYFYQEVVRANRLGFKHGSDLEAALHLLREGTVDLVLIDALEKEETKYELVRRLKEDEPLSRIPVVVLSIYEEEEPSFIQLGVDRFVPKPFLVEKFVATLKQLLARRRDG